jgi:hypothetical protein
MTEAKASRICIKVYSLFKSENSNVNIKLTLHKALIRSVMNYACPICEFTAAHQHLKLQRQHNMVLRITEHFPRPILVRDLRSAFNLPYIYDYIKKTLQAISRSHIKHENGHVLCIGQGEARHRKY